MIKLRWEAYQPVFGSLGQYSAPYYIENRFYSVILLFVHLTQIMHMANACNIYI